MDSKYIKAKRPLVDIIMKDNSVLRGNIILPPKDDITWYRGTFIVVMDLDSAIIPVDGVNSTLLEMGEHVHTFGGTWTKSLINVDEIKSIHFIDEERRKEQMERSMSNLVE